MVMSGGGDGRNGEPADGEAPLDPAVERVQARLRRLMLVSTLTALVGFCAVAVAVVYRLSADGDSPRDGAAEAVPAPARPERLEARLPVAGEVVSVRVDGGLVVVQLAPGPEGTTTVLLIDRADGDLVQRIDLLPAEAGGRGLPDG